MVADLRVCVGTGQPPQVLGHTPSDHFNINLIETGAETMTGGRLRRVLEHLRPGTFMLTYGDAVADIDLRALLKFHRQHQRIGTVTGVHPTLPFGEIALDKAGFATGFSEKPQMNDVWINGGYFVFEPEFAKYLEVSSGDADALVLERAPLEQLARDGQLAVFKHEGFWSCMDTFKDVERLNALWAKSNPAWKVW
jgi:glucose-1-phosphate cytidylyltransferase